MSRAKTKEEVLDEFMSCVVSCIDYWSSDNIKERGVRGRLEGLTHSILCVLDGCTASLPAFDLLASPHPSDKQYCIDNDEDWYEPIVINDDVHLKNLMYKYLRGAKE